MLSAAFGWVGLDYFRFSSEPVGFRGQLGLPMETCRPRDSSSTASGKEVYMEEEEEEVMYEEELCDDEEEVASAVQDIGRTCVLN